MIFCSEWNVLECLSQVAEGYMGESFSSKEQVVNKIFPIENNPQINSTSMNVSVMPNINIQQNNQTTSEVLPPSKPFNNCQIIVNITN